MRARKPWELDESDELVRLYNSDCKTTTTGYLPWRQIVKQLNKRFKNKRTVSACQRKLYRVTWGWDLIG